MMVGVPKITVVIPAFKAATTIGKAVQSCLDDRAGIEIVVIVDGADVDLSMSIPRADSVRVIVNPSTIGAPAARNIGLRAASGEFVLFLDADDYVEGGLIGALGQRAAIGQADVAFGSYAFELPSGRRIPVNIVDTVGEPNKLNLLKAWFAGNYVPSCSVLWRAKFLRSIGGWDEAMLKNQDGELIWRACRADPRMALASAGLGIYVQRQSPHRVSGRLSDRTLKQQLELLERTVSELSHDELRLLSTDIGAMYYRLARVAYYNDFIDVGVSAESAARHLGYVGHAGSTMHRVFAALFGLKLKERFCVKLHRIEDALGLLRLRVRLLAGIEQ